MRLHLVAAVIFAVVLGAIVASAQPAKSPGSPDSSSPALTLEQWTLAALHQHAPISGRPSFPGHDETDDEVRARYAALALAITSAAEEHPAKPGGLSDRDEAALLVAIAIGETRLARDTDVGPCYRGKPGGSWWSRCDSGTSGSVWQLKTPLSWEGEVIRYADTFKDRERAARIALRAARGSLGACRALPPEDRLSALGGVCREGLESARARYRLWQRVRVWEPSP